METFARYALNDTNEAPRSGRESMRKIGARLAFVRGAGWPCRQARRQTGKGVPSNQFRGGGRPVDGVRRILGKVPANTTMSFPAVLAPGRNEAVLWADAADVTKHKRTAARLRGTINIINRKNATCLRSAQLAVDATSFDLAKARNPGDLAPGAGNRNNKNNTKPAQPPARSGAPR